MHLADCSVIETLDEGAVPVRVQNKTSVMRRVYYAPSLQLNVISCSRLGEKGIKLTFNHMERFLSKRHDINTLLGTTIKDEKNGLYKSRIEQPNGTAQVRIVS